MEAADAGYYPCVVDPKELEEMRANPARVRELFVEQMKKGLKRWLSLAEERLRGTGVSCYISPGNDDYFEIDEILDSSPFTVNPEGKVVGIDGEHEMDNPGLREPHPLGQPARGRRASPGREDRGDGLRREGHAQGYLQPPRSPHRHPARPPRQSWTTTSSRSSQEGPS